jgi:hypothetical protein
MVDRVGVGTQQRGLLKSRKERAAWMTAVLAKRRGLVLVVLNVSPRSEDWGVVLISGAKRKQKVCPTGEKGLTCSAIESSHAKIVSLPLGIACGQ